MDKNGGVEIAAILLIGLFVGCDNGDNDNCVSGYPLISEEVTRM